MAGEEVKSDKRSPGSVFSSPDRRGRRKGVSHRVGVEVRVGEGAWTRQSQLYVASSLRGKNVREAYYSTL